MPIEFSLPPRLKVLAIVIALAAACSGGGHAKAQSSTSSQPISTSTPATSAAPTSSAVSSSVLSCPTSVLAASLAKPGAAAGTVYYHLLFRNNSSVPCTLTGYPGVSFVDSAGTQIGAAVPRDHRFSGTAIVGPGGSAGALFAVHNAYVGTFPSCNPTQSTGLRVFPPGQTVALIVQQAFTVCSNPAADGTASISEVTQTANLP